MANLTLPEPFSDVRVEVQLVNNDCAIRVQYIGSPARLIASGVVEPEMIAPGRNGSRVVSIRVASTTCVRFVGARARRR